jgi:hypothetical protein
MSRSCLPDRRPGRRSGAVVALSGQKVHGPAARPDVCTSGAPAVGRRTACSGRAREALPFSVATGCSSAW